MNEGIMNKAHQQAVDNLNSYTMVGKVTENLKLEDMKMPDECGYTTISEFHNLIKHDDPLYKEGFKAGAASRDAKIKNWSATEAAAFIPSVLEYSSSRDAEIAELKARLEYNEDGWDGIACRDETIRLLEQGRDQLHEQVAILREALEFCAGTSYIDNAHREANEALTATTPHTVGHNKEPS